MYISFHPIPYKSFFPFQMRIDHFAVKIMKNYIRINLHSGKNSQISLFFEIIGVLPPFEKYLVIYHFFETRLLQTQVWHGTQI